MTSLVNRGDGEESVPVRLQAGMEDDIQTPLCVFRQDHDRVGVSSSMGKSLYEG